MNLEFIKPQNLGSLLMKSSQSNLNLRQAFLNKIEFRCPFVHSRRQCNLNLGEKLTRRISLSTKFKLSPTVGFFIKTNEIFRLGLAFWAGSSAGTLMPNKRVYSFIPNERVGLLF